MPVLRMSSHIEYYRYLAGQSKIHRLAGRGDDRATTQFANARLLEVLELEQQDVLLDVGCGDGSLLKQADGLVHARIGITPTDEEMQLLEMTVPRVTFLRGEVNEIPLEPASASKIVCNSVLLLLDSEAGVRKALGEISRVARRGSIICLGEIPAADELAYFHKYRGNSVIGFVTHELKKKGVRAFLSSVREAGDALLGEHTLVLNSANVYHAAPDRFIEMAAEQELHMVRIFKHVRLDASGVVVESPLRYNYLFRKAS